MPTTQANRLIEIDTPLGKDVLILRGFTGHEGISKLFKLDCDLFSEGSLVEFQKIIGQRVSIKVRLSDEKQRYFNGFVSRFTQTSGEMGVIRYRAEIVPWLWFLTRTTDCRIFQNKTVPDILEQIFKDLGFTDYKVNLDGTYDQLEYCVQYRETDFDFVSRLMEQYGIFYFFEHQKDSHILQLADSPTKHQPLPHQPKVSYGSKTSGPVEDDVIMSMEFEKELRSGQYAHTDFNFKMPDTSLSTDEPSVINIGGNGKYEIYDYPGEYLDKTQGARLAKIRMQEEEAQHFIVSGNSTCRAFTSGYKFDIEDYSLIEKDKKTHVLTEIQHICSIGEPDSSSEEAIGEDSYHNSFTCIPFSVPYRSRQVTTKPIVQGPQTALVIGPQGHEIWCDPYGRIKIQFHWDREGKKDEESSCFVRVSQIMAGKHWGAQFIPRIGQEVIVEFLEGDPDKPIVTGCVYNEVNKPPYNLPDGQTQSGIKTRSSKGGNPENFNEIRFEDKKGQELLNIHAEKDYAVTAENDQSLSVGQNRTKTVGGDETQTVTGNKTVGIGKNLVESITGNMSLSVEGAKTDTTTLASAESVGAAKSLSIIGAFQVTVGGAMNETVVGIRGEETGGAKLEVVGGYKNETIVRNKTLKVGTTLKETAKKWDMQAEKEALIVSDKIILKAGEKASITLNSSGEIVIKGTKIIVNATEELKMSSPTVSSN